MSKAMILDHPLVQHKVSLLRDKNTGTKEFKALVSELAMLLCYEATRDLPTKEVSIETPVAMAQTRVLSGRKLAVVPIENCRMMRQLSLVFPPDFQHPELLRELQAEYNRRIG